MESRSLAKKEFKKRRKRFLKGATSEEPKTWVMIHFNSEEEAEHWRNLAIKHKKLAEPEVANQPLDSLYLFFPKGQRGMALLDSDLLWDIDNYKYRCISCGNLFYEEKKVPVTRRRCPHCLEEYLTHYCEYEGCGKSFQAHVKNKRFCSKICSLKAHYAKDKEKRRVREVRREFKDIGQEATNLILEKQRVELEREFVEITVARERRWKEEESRLKERIGILRVKVSNLQERERKRRARLKEHPQCSDCGIVLTILNQYPSQRKQGRNICKVCMLSRSTERYNKMKELEDSGKI